MEKLTIRGLLSPACLRVLTTLIQSFPAVENVKLDDVFWANTKLDDTGRHDGGGVVIAAIDYDFSQYSIEVADSIAIAVEREGYEVTCSHGVTIWYLSMNEVVTNEFDCKKIKNILCEYEWVKRVYVDVMTSVVRVFVRSHTREEELTNCLKKLPEGYGIPPDRDVCFEVTHRDDDGDGEGEVGGVGLKGSREGCQLLYNILKKFAGQNKSGFRCSVSTVYINASASPPRARVKGHLSLNELSLYLRGYGYEVRSCKTRQRDLQPVLEASRVGSVSSCLAGASFCSDTFSGVHSHAHGGFLQVPEGDAEGGYDFLDTDMASSLESTESSLFGSPIPLTPPRDLGATPLTWKANNRNLNHESHQRGTAIVESSISPAGASGGQSNTKVAKGPDIMKLDRRNSHRPKKSRADVIQIGHTANLMATFSLGGGGAEDLCAEKIHQIEEEVRRQCLLAVPTDTTPIGGSGRAKNPALRKLYSRSSSSSYDRKVESMAAAVHEVNVYLFEEKVEILFDSSLLQWPMFVDSISRAGFQATLLELRGLNHHQDYRTRRFLFSSNTTQEDIQHDLFSGMVDLEKAGGVISVRWIEDTPTLRADITVLLQNPESDAIFSCGTFAVMEVVYDSLVLPLFELYEMVVMSSSNRVHIIVFPSDLFIRRHEKRILPSTSDEEIIPSISQSSSPCVKLQPSTSFISDEDEVMRATRDRLEYLQIQCGRAFVVTAVLVLIAVYNPLIANSGKRAENGMADSEVFVKLDFYEVISLILSSFVVFFPGMSVSKDTVATMKSWQNIRQNPYLIIGLAMWSAYALGLMSLLTVFIYLHMLGGSTDHHYLTSLGLDEIKPVEYFLLAAVFVTCYLAVIVFNARNHFKWPIPGSSQARSIHVDPGSTSEADTIDLLAQSFLMLRPQFCALLVVDYLATAGEVSKLTNKSSHSSGSIGGPQIGDYSYEVIREKIISSEVLKRGDLICVKRGEVIPADGEVVRGRAKVEEGLLTGELTVLGKEPGDYVLGGSTLLACGAEGIHVLVRCEVEQSLLEQLLRLSLQSAFDKRHRSHRKRVSETGAMLWEPVSSVNASNGLVSQTQAYVPSFQFFPLASTWQFRIVRLYNFLILMSVMFMWISWNIHGLMDMSVLFDSHHFGVMFFWINFFMSMSLAFSMFLLACPVMMGILFANALVLYLASQISYARYGIGIQPARAMLRRMSKLSTLVWSKQSLSEPHLEVTSVYLLSGYGSGLVLVGGLKREGLDAVDKLCLEGIRPSHCFSDQDHSGVPDPMQDDIFGGHGSPRDSNDDEYLSEDLVVFLAGASQLPLQRERPISLAITTYANMRLSHDLVTPTSFELAPCGGVKCCVSLPTALAASMGGVQRPVDVVTGSLDFLRHERIRFSANSLFGNMANLANKTHGANVMFIAINGQVSGMLQIQRRILSDTEVTVRAFEARKVQNWMTSGDPVRCNMSVGLEAGISALNVVSDVYPQQLLKRISHLQKDDNEVVGYVMPGMDEIESSICVHGVDPSMLTDSRRNMYFLGKLLHSMPAMFQADVGVCRRSSSFAVGGRVGSQFRNAGELEVDIARRLFESASDIVILAQSSDLKPQRTLSYDASNTDDNTGPLLSSSNVNDESSTYRLFGLVAVIDLSEKIDYLLRIMTNTLVIGGLLWLICLLVVMYLDALVVIRATLSSAVLSSSDTSTMVNFLLLCWLPLYPPGKISVEALSIYIVILFSCIICCQFVYVLGYYRPPRRKAYLGLTKSSSSTLLDFSRDYTVTTTSPPAGRISLPNNLVRTSSNKSDESSQFLKLESVLSFTGPGSDSPMARDSSKKRQHFFGIVENDPLLSDSPSSQGRGSVRSYGSVTSRSVSPNKSSPGKEYGSLEMEDDDYDFDV